MTPVRLDVTSTQEALDAAVVVREALGTTRLRGVVNNAGIAVGGPLEFLDLDEMRRQLEELLGFMDGRVDAEKRIAQLLNNEPLLGKIAGQALADDDKVGE